MNSEAALDAINRAFFPPLRRKEEGVMIKGTHTAISAACCLISIYRLRSWLQYGHPLSASRRRSQLDLRSRAWRGLCTIRALRREWSAA